MSTFRTASIDEYINWLRGHLAKGGAITHTYDYPFARVGMLMALADFTTGGECGSDAAQIIVPKNVRHLGGGIGHNELYFMDTFTTGGRGFVPAFSDPEFDALPGVPQARARDAAERAAFEEDAKQREAEHAARVRRSDLSAYRARN